MTLARATALVSGVTVLTAWLVSAAVTRPREQPAPRAAREETRLDRLAEEVRTQADRLRSRLERAPAPNEPGRNLFRFAPRPTPRAATAADVDSPAAPFGILPAAPAIPTLRLVGMTSDRAKDGLLRTAVLSVGGEVGLFKVGDEVAGRYVLTALDAETVELRDLLGGAPLCLTLR